MELSVRCYYVSVSYDKFIKQTFLRSVNFPWKDMQGPKNLMHHNPEPRVFPVCKNFKAGENFSTTKTPVLPINHEKTPDSGISSGRKCGVGEI